MKRARLLFYLNNADGELSNEDAFILRDSGFVQQKVRVGRAVARPSTKTLDWR